MTPLCELAQKYGTDKYPWYTPFYHLILGPHRKTFKTVVEIGIGTSQMDHMPNYRPGASLHMWRDYFPNAEIIGIDRDINAPIEGSRIFLYQADQGDQDSIVRVPAYQIDLIVDDGSHHSDHQFNTLQLLWPRLNYGGIYIIEDVNEPLALTGYKYSSVECHAPFNPHAGRCVLIQR
jgi:hypothetical protein